MNARPPGRVSILWCPACGRDDRLTFLRQYRPHNRPDGKRCTGTVRELEYVLPTAPESFPTMPTEGTYCAAVAVEVAITPPPPHLRDGTYRRAFVGQTTLLYASTAEELALLVETFSDLLTRQVGDAIAVHPRPAPPTEWLT